MKHALLRLSFVACSVTQALGQSRSSVSFQATTQVVDGSILHLTGSVQIATAQRSIQADAVDYNVTTGEIQAWGNVQVKTEGPEGRGALRGDMVKGSLVGINQWWVKGFKQ